MITVLEAEKLSLVEIEGSLAASESVRFAGYGCRRTEIYKRGRALARPSRTVGQAVDGWLES